MQTIMRIKRIQSTRPIKRFITRREDTKSIFGLIGHPIIRIMMIEGMGKGMAKYFFDYDSGDFAMSISDNMAINSDGGMMMRMGDNMAMDMDTGDIHIISAWPNDDD